MHGYGVCSCSCLLARVYPPTQPVPSSWLLRPAQLSTLCGGEHGYPTAQTPVIHFCTRVRPFMVTAVLIHSHAQPSCRQRSCLLDMSPPQSRHPSRLREQKNANARPGLSHSVFHMSMIVQTFTCCERLRSLEMPLPPAASPQLCVSKRDAKHRPFFAPERDRLLVASPVFIGCVAMPNRVMNVPIRSPMPSTHSSRKAFVRPPMLSSQPFTLSIPSSPYRS